jgi:hypothetical protein
MDDDENYVTAEGPSLPPKKIAGPSAFREVSLAYASEAGDGSEMDDNDDVWDADAASSTRHSDDVSDSNKKESMKPDQFGMTVRSVAGYTCVIL